MIIFEWIIIIAAILVMIYFSWGIRIYTIRAIRPTMSTVNFTMLLSIALFLKFIFNFSALHIIWLIPVCITVAFLSRSSDSPISNLGWIFAHICCIGLDQKEREKNVLRQKRFQELVKSGVKPDEARVLIIKEETESNI